MRCLLMDTSLVISYRSVMFCLCGRSAHRPRGDGFSQMTFHVRNGQTEQKRWSLWLLHLETGTSFREIWNGYTKKDLFSWSCSIKVSSFIHRSSCPPLSPRPSCQSHSIIKCKKIIFKKKNKAIAKLLGPVHSAYECKGWSQQGSLLCFRYMTV